MTHTTLETMGADADEIIQWFTLKMKELGEAGDAHLTECFKDWSNLLAIYRKMGREGESAWLDSARRDEAVKIHRLRCNVVRLMYQLGSVVQAHIHKPR